MLKNVKPGLDQVVYNHPDFSAVAESIAVSSPAFAQGGSIPVEYTADGQGISPPLEWHGVPGETWGLVLIIEDADSPTPEPLTHAVVTGLPATNDTLGPGALEKFGAQYLPPDPPPGHGPHRYVFQVFTLDQLIHVSKNPSKAAIFEAMRGHVLAKGCLIGIYERK